jgi:hypothetical protein
LRSAIGQDRSGIDGSRCVDCDKRTRNRGRLVDRVDAGTAGIDHIAAGGCNGNISGSVSEGTEAVRRFTSRGRRRGKCGDGDAVTDIDRDVAIPVIVGVDTVTSAGDDIAANDDEDICP